MNEMEQLRKLAQETPLPAPAELEEARARLLAAIAADPATSAADPVTAATAPPAAPAVAGATAGQPDSFSGHPAEPLRPTAPAPVLAAARFMYGGAISSAALLIVALPFAGDVKGNVLGHRLTPTPLIITLVILAGLAVIGLWLWMARVTTQGRGWARILSTVLFGLATLELLSALEAIGTKGVAQAFLTALTWLSGLGAVWMLWRPASRAFFESAKQMRSRPPSQISGPLTALPGPGRQCRGHPRSRRAHGPDAWQDADEDQAGAPCEITRIYS
jgi:hypothetical protein